MRVLNTRVRWISRSRYSFREINCTWKEEDTSDQMFSLSLPLSRICAYIKITIIDWVPIKNSHISLASHTEEPPWCYFTLQTSLIVNHLILWPAVNVPFYRTPITVMQARCSSRHLPAAPHHAPSRLSNVTNWRCKFKPDFRFFLLHIRVHVYISRSIWRCFRTNNSQRSKFWDFICSMIRYLHFAIRVMIKIDVNLVNNTENDMCRAISLMRWKARICAFLWNRNAYRATSSRRMQIWRLIYKMH